MTTATVVGAGIGGPIAALMLERQGYDVTLHEQRNGPAGFNSLHVLTLQDETKQGLLDMGLKSRDLFRVQENYMTKEQSDGPRLASQWTSPWPLPANTNVMWNDLHDALVKRCTVTYGSRVSEVPDTDLTVWSDGVGSFGRETFSSRKGTYAGEMVFRGYVPRQESDITWYMSQSVHDAYQMVSYPCWDRSGNTKRGWTLMLKSRRELWDDTEILSVSQQDSLNRFCRDIMHATPYRLVSESEETTGSPQLIWPDVRQAAYRHNGQLQVIMGDALGTVSPKTAMGANMAIMEGLSLTAGTLRAWNTATVSEVNNALQLSKEYITE